MSKSYEIYTDGSSTKDGGGWGMVVFEIDDETGSRTLFHHNYQYYKEITNNQAELLALLCAYSYCDEHPELGKVTIYSDSAYCVNAITDWAPRIWVNNGWKNSQKKLIENYELIRSIYFFSVDDSLCWRVGLVKIKGHCGNVGNELADRLATGNFTAFDKICEEKKIIRMDLDA